MVLGYTQSLVLNPIVISQRGFLRQLMVTGAETYNQTLGADGAQIGDPYQVPSSEAWELHRRGRRIVETRETKDTSRM